MCGRYSLAVSADDVIKHFQLKNGICLTPRYNISPNEIIPVIKEKGKVDFLQWGFIPGWLKNKEQKPFINARVETVQEKPSFRDAFKKRRCLIIADGYYEWLSAGRIKQPYYIHQKAGQIFALAGIWEGDTCAILTIGAHAPLVDLHARMPIILPVDAYAPWLNPTSDLKKIIEPLLGFSQTENLEIYPVSPQMNAPRFEGPECIRPFQL